MRPVTIHRRTRREAEQAVDDLLKRGFELISPIMNMEEWGKDFERDMDGRRKFAGNRKVKSCWVAKLRKVEQK